MNDQSPPKRVTRARAAAKTTDTKTTKIATAASKAKVTRNASTTKRKTRADEAQEEEDETRPEPIIEPDIPKSTRGRPRRAAAAQPEPEPEMEEEAPATTKPTRGRPKKNTSDALALEPARSLRGRAKKTMSVEDNEDDPVVVEKPEEPSEVPPRKTTRTRAATTSKTVAPKKSVKFEEPDKENIAPLPAKGKAKAPVAETGIKAKPVRKPTAARKTRGRAKVEEKEQKSSPLSPKKVTQVGAAKDNSDDELAASEKTPMKPLMKSPIKAPGSIFGASKKLDFSNSNTIAVNRATTQDFGSSLMASPARRPPTSAFKESLKTSPSRHTPRSTLFRSPLKVSLPSAQQHIDESVSSKPALLQSPAKRPLSPIKVTAAGSPTMADGDNKTLFGHTPRTNTFKISRFATPRTVSRPENMAPPSALQTSSMGSPRSKNVEDGSDLLLGARLQFSGRLSSIVPRDVDPALSSTNTTVEAIGEITTSEGNLDAEPITVDTIVVEEPSNVQSTTPVPSPPRNSTGSFALREECEDPFQASDSEDELASMSPRYSPASLSPFKIAPPGFASSVTPLLHNDDSFKTPNTAAGRRRAAKEKIEYVGFTPLARQLSDWMGASPEKIVDDEQSEETTPKADQPISLLSTERAIQPSPAKSTYFDDEMSVREDMQASCEPELIDDVNFTPPAVDEQDLALAHEADEMSLLEPAEIEEMSETHSDVAFEAASVECVEPNFEEFINPEFDQMEMVDVNDHQLELSAVEEPALSEASQEYGDENVMPIEMALQPLPSQALPSTPEVSTPKRVLSERTYHTVSKVPLKSAAEDTPPRKSPMKRSATVSRVPAQRPTSGLARSNTVISYTPVKRTPRSYSRQEDMEDVEMEVAQNTPSKSQTDAWSMIGTPARTPRRDINTSLLNGAVVFVDVHTTEGADASALFTELLTQMGARCVKSWSWNGNVEDGKVGITHVVFKDGGKRTLEKTREAGHVVSCVGVGWVLDCERENKWLPESPYSVDTTMVPRGGHRRRKSMEPRALANMNGTLLPSSTPTRPTRKTMSPTKVNKLGQTPQNSKSRRRESVQWVRSPASSSSGNDQSIDDQTGILSPVPNTPAPEAIRAYCEEGFYGNETPGAQTPYFLHKEQLVQKTAPAGKRFFDEDENENVPGKGFLPEKKDESVMMRLMAARRKSLQWAPKVGSPLARGQEW